MLPEGGFWVVVWEMPGTDGETEAGALCQGESSAEFLTWLCAVLPNENKEPETRYFRQQGTSSSLQRPWGNKPAGDISRPRGTSRSPPNVPLCVVTPRQLALGPQIPSPQRESPGLPPLALPLSSSVRGAQRGKFASPRAPEQVGTSSRHAPAAVSASQGDETLLSAREGRAQGHPNPVFSRISGVQVSKLEFTK